MELYPESNISIFSLIKRRHDREGMVSKDNIMIEKFCKESSVHYINNDNITLDTLNGSGIHLGKKETYVLAKNIVKHLDSF